MVAAAVGCGVPKGPNNHAAYRPTRLLEEKEGPVATRVGPANWATQARRAGKNLAGGGASTAQPCAAQPPVSDPNATEAVA